VDVVASVASETIEIQIKVETAGSSAVDLLTGATALSKSRIKDAMNKGAVWLIRRRSTRRLRRVDRVLRQGDQLQLCYNPRILSEVPATPSLLADRNQYSVWYKPRRMLATGSQFGDHCALSRWVEKHLRPPRPVFVVHRLDRESRGLMLLAHTREVAAQLSKEFKERLVEKHYRVVVQGELKREGTVELPIDGRQATTHLIATAYDPHEQTTLVDVKIETGRKHQIRRHLAAIGYPLVGDARYGDDDKREMELVAHQLAFSCPTTSRWITFSVPAELMAE
jgi:tRNA pseudouridine32 synthase/23S rRNA pseudouridine746 synthase|tara:strand:- start:2665 stop:3507 length:843 start_codon:yes stop_codon:yes gene_type:complete